VIAYVKQWVLFLQSTEALSGLPLVAIGVVLMLMGWRVWKAAVVATFALIGAGVGVALAGDDPGRQWFFALLGGVLLGAASYPPANYSICLLGGLIGAGVAHTALTSMWVQGTPLWIAMVLVFAGCTAVAIVYSRQVIVAVTSVEGAVLIISGLVAVVADAPQLFHFFESIARNYWFFLPFLLLVPTVTGFLLQLADAKKHDAGMTGGA
jgi:hypothetical protein